MKTWRDADQARDPAEAGLEQLDERLARLVVSVGWLVRFDPRTIAAPLPEGLAVEAATTAHGRRVTRMLP